MILAASDEISWQMIFERDELFLRVEKIHRSRPDEPEKRMTIEDFLIATPHDPVQQEAVDRLCDLLDRITSQ